VVPETKRKNRAATNVRGVMRKERFPRMSKITKKTPEGITHQPKAMAWAQLTTANEIKKLEKTGAVEIPEGTTHNPMPVSKATASLRRAYPYIFDCAAYVLSRAPEMIREGDLDDLYKYIKIPVGVFYEYCLDGC
jgi:hypothetical protein